MFEVIIDYHKVNGSILICIPSVDVMQPSTWLHNGSTHRHSNWHSFPYDGYKQVNEQLGPWNPSSQATKKFHYSSFKIDCTLIFYESHKN